MTTRLRRIAYLALALCLLFLSSSCGLYQIAYDEAYLKGLKGLGVYAYQATDYAGADFLLKEEVYEIKDGVFTVTGYMGIAYDPDPDVSKITVGYVELYTDRRDCKVNGTETYRATIEDLLTNDLYKGDSFKVRKEFKKTGALDGLKKYRIEYVDILLPTERTEVRLEFTPGKRSGILHIDVEIHETAGRSGPSRYVQLYYALDEEHLVFSSESRYDAEQRLKAIGD